MMKNFKLLFLSVVLAAGFFTSCTNDEPVVEEQNIEESASITTSLSELSLQYNSVGDVESSENPSGNIVFDFCFDFVYPLNLSYNTGATVTVNSLEDLVEIIINSNENLFINGIAFPFDVETYNDDTDAIEVVTINNEEEFIDLLEDCDFDDDFDCECNDEYDPVCVEIETPDGEFFVVTYPNECFAICDGFTEADFTENCEEDYNNSEGNECFTFNYPLTIITDNNETITVDSQEELNNALYNTYNFDFVYPFSVTDDEGEVEVIENEEDFEDILEDCYDDSEGTDDCECTDEFDPVCVQEEVEGQLVVFVFPNACIAECEGFSAEDFVECDDNNPSDCTEEDYIVNLTECAHYAYFLNSNDDEGYEVQFSADGTLTISNEDGSFTTTGTWEFGTNTADGFATIVIDAEANDFDDIWGITGCDVVYMFSTSQTFVIDVICEDDNNPAECSEDDIAEFLQECEWHANTSLFNIFVAETFGFESDGTVTITNSESGDTTEGTWEIASNPEGGITIFFGFNNDPYAALSQFDWTVVACNEGFIGLESENEFLSFERDCE